MFDPNNEFPEKIKPYEKITVILFLALVAGTFIWGAYHFYTVFTAFEAGEDITVGKTVGFLYDLGGKWTVIAVLIFCAVYCPYLLFNKFKKEWIKKQIEKTY